MFRRPVLSFLSEVEVPDSPKLQRVSCGQGRMLKEIFPFFFVVDYWEENVLV